jgi:ABC-type transport system involved in cytochrome c biogenesis permease component
MENKLYPSLRTLFTLMAVGMVVYFVLLHDKHLFIHTSITCIIAYAHTLTMTEHLLVLALLPIYIAVIIFGTALFAAYAETKIEFLVKRSIKSKKPLPLKSSH